MNTHTDRSRLAADTRDERLRMLRSRHFDVLVIGGGVTGAEASWMRTLPGGARPLTRRPPSSRVTVTSLTSPGSAVSCTTPKAPARMFVPSAHHALAGAAPASDATSTASSAVPCRLILSPCLVPPLRRRW